jgi:hypothetical protein
MIIKKPEHFNILLINTYTKTMYLVPENKPILGVEVENEPNTESDED